MLAQLSHRNLTNRRAFARTALNRFTWTRFDAADRSLFGRRNGAVRLIAHLED